MFSTCAIIGSAVISELPPSSLVQQDTSTTIPKELEFILCLARMYFFV